MFAITDEETKKVPMITNSPSNPQTIGDYFKAMFNAHEGKVDEAQAELQKLNSVSAPAVIRKKKILLWGRTKQFNKIIEQLNMVDKDSADDPEVQLTTIEALFNSNKKQQAIERLLKSIDKFPEDQGFTMIAVQWYLENKNPENALIVIDRYLSNALTKSNNYILYFLKAQILSYQHQTERALEAVKECLASNRNFTKGWLLYALLEEQAGNLDAAIKGYETFLDIVGREPAVQNHLLDLLFKQKMIKEHKITLATPPSCFQKALLLFEQNQHTDALKMIEECVKKEPNNDQAHHLEIQILENLGEIQQAFNLSVELLNAHPNNELWYQTASSLFKKGIRRHDLVTAFAQVEKKNPRSMLPVQYLADLYLRSNNQQQSLVYLQKVIDLTQDALLKAKAHYQKARIFHLQHNVQAMAKELEAGHAANSNFAPLNNMLAYYYAAKGNDQAKAHQLITQSLANDPTNPHYLDTLGYISYKQGNIQEALKIIEPLASRMPDDTVIENHVRKIHQGFAHNGRSGGQ